MKPPMFGRCAVGTEEYLRNREAVHDFLLDHGVDLMRTFAVWFSESEMLVSQYATDPYGRCPYVWRGDVARREPFWVKYRAEESVTPKK